MLTLLLVDRSAEGRQDLHRQFEYLLSEPAPEFDLVPRITFKSVSPNELKFQSRPSIIVCGHELVEHELPEVGNIRRLFPDIPMLARVPRRSRNLALVDQLARMGIDDLFDEEMLPQQFLEKLMVLARRTHSVKAGKLVIVDSAKGGVGVTSIAAGLAEVLVSREKRVCVVDLDFESQDLSRFLQARPFLNESLQLLLAEERVPNEDLVKDCLVQIWDEEDRFFCVPPAPETEGLYDSRGHYPRALIAVLEIIDAAFDVVVVDTGSARGAMLQSLYHHADLAVFVVNNDPASLYASMDRASKLGALLSPQSRLVFVENETRKSGLPTDFLRAEFLRLVTVKGASFSGPIPFCRDAGRWPGSGGTLASSGLKGIEHALLKLLSDGGLLEHAETRGEKGLLRRLLPAGLRRAAKRRAVTHEADLAKGLSAPSSAESVVVTPPQSAPELRPGLPEPEHLLTSPTFTGSTVDPIAASAAAVSNEHGVVPPPLRADGQGGNTSTSSARNLLSPPVFEHEAPSFTASPSGAVWLPQTDALDSKPQEDTQQLARVSELVGGVTFR